MYRLSQTHKGHDFGIRMPEDMMQEIDRVRGDCPRNVWIRRAAVAELERIKKKNNTVVLQGASNDLSQAKHLAAAPPTTEEEEMDANHK
jgi:hypothetical protein